MNESDAKRIGAQAINLLELIEDASEHFCDENMCSGEQFYIMMSSLCECKLREFPYDLEGEIDD